MNEALVHSLIDHRNRGIQQLAAQLLVRGRNRGAQFLDLRAQLAAIASVDLVSFDVLPNSLFGGFMICH